TPASSSSQFSMGVTSTATVGPKLDPPPLRLQPAAPPSSTTAADSLAADWAKAFPEQSKKDAINMDFVVAFTTSSTNSLCLYLGISRMGFDLSAKLTLDCLRTKCRT